MADIGGFISAPIKLAAIINDRRLTGQVSELFSERSSSRSRRRSRLNNNNNNNKNNNNDNNEPLKNTTNKAHFRSHLRSKTAANLAVFGLLPLLFLLLLISTTTWPSIRAKLIVGGANLAEDLVRHHTHYMNIVPSTHFHYKEGRQLSLKEEVDQLSSKQLAGAQVEERSAEATLRQQQQQQQQNGPSDGIQDRQMNSHIYKRSSALISSSAGAHYPPLVGTMQPVHQLNPLSRRMMSEAAHTRWTSPRMVQPPNEQALLANNEEQQLAELLANHLNVNNYHQIIQQNQTDLSASNEQVQAPTNVLSKPVSQITVVSSKKHDEAELLRQKQHIQYHDQWPSMAGKCHKRTLNFCASVLPFNTTTFPNIIGDTNRFEVKRSLPFFGFLAKSSCNKRLDELLCLLLEPPCGAQSGLAIPPCKKFCRLALEGCNEYIPATLAMSSVFDCRQYPDSTDPNVCINLAQGSKCAADEFKCPDKTCVPRNWLCDGVRDCIFAADEANCTALTGIGLQTSVCSTEEFKCDGKCVPKAWKCDGERDCLDGTDEEACDQRPRCGPDRFKCADGNGCLPKRWVCDGKAECRDGSDELNCEQLECSENDFKCDNGICIPKLWRCDRQADCKDGSDERSCIYPVSTTSAAPTTLFNNIGATEQPLAYLNNSSVASTLTAAPDTTRPTPTAVVDLVVETTSQQQPSINHQQQLPGDVILTNHYYASGPDQRQSSGPAQPTRQQQLEMDLSDDVSSSIQQEPSYSSSSSPPPQSVSVASDQSPAGEAQQVSTAQSVEPSQQQRHQQLAAKELKKFDYDIIQSPSSSPSLIQMSTLLSSADSQATQQNSARLPTQVDFVPQQQQQQQQQAPTGRQAIPASVSNQQAQRMASRNNQIHQPDGRSRTFGQVIKAAKWSGAEMQVGQQQQQQQQQQPVAVDRVPIYRSLFKTLKSGGRTFGGASQAEHGGYAGVTVRRRRDRHHRRPFQPTLTTTSTTTMVHSSSSPMPVGQTEPDLARISHWTSSSPVPPEASGGQTVLQIQQHQPAQVNYTMIAQPVAQQRSHGVASYLQLLQSRYNLRLPRASSLSPLP